MREALLWVTLRRLSSRDGRILNHKDQASSAFSLQVSLPPQSQMTEELTDNSNGGKCGVTVALATRVEQTGVSRFLC